MTDRDRLKELLENSPYLDVIDGGFGYGYEKAADHLISNGVILPPCKVGDRYVMDTAKTIFNTWNDVTGALVEGTSWYYELESVIEDIVKLSFGAGVLYREEAERQMVDGYADALVERTKAEAIKEFAERVKLEFYYEFDELIPSVMADKIDNLVKEMVGEEDV